MNEKTPISPKLAIVFVLALFMSGSLLIGTFIILGEFVNKLF